MPGGHFPRRTGGVPQLSRSGHRLLCLWAPQGLPQPLASGQVVSPLPPSPASLQQAAGGRARSFCEALGRNRSFWKLGPERGRITRLPAGMGAGRRASSVRGPVRPSVSPGLWAGSALLQTEEEPQGARAGVTLLRVPHGEGGGYRE